MSRRHRSSSASSSSSARRRISFPGSGATVDPTAIFREITAGTSFENDEKMQGHLRVFADSFLNVARTAEGQTMLFSLEGVGRAIRDRNGFVDSVKMMFRLAKKVGANPMVQFGLFMGFLGVITALVAHFGPVGLVGVGLQTVLRRIYLMIFTSALTPLYKVLGSPNNVTINYGFFFFVLQGVTSAIGSFFSERSGGFLSALDSDLNSNNAGEGDYEYCTPRSTASSSSRSAASSSSSSRSGRSRRA